MTTQELQNKLNKLKQKYQSKKKLIIQQYCNQNNPYKIGDKFTDHIGTIIIEKINYSYQLQCCSYYGSITKKNGTPHKNKKRIAWQFNDITANLDKPVLPKMH